MIDLIKQNREQIIDLCKRFGVQRLEVFGSAARERGFNPASSDVDFF